MARSEASDGARLERLLGLYSVQKLSSHFGSKERTKEGIIRDIAESHSREDIVNFAFRYHSTTKHHVEIYEHARVNPARLTSDPLGLPRLERQERTASESVWFYLVELTYTVYLRDPLEHTTLDFLWPVRARCTPTILELAFTVMEKDLTSRFPAGRVVRTIKVVDEKLVSATLRTGLDLPEAGIADLNRGVKSLWEDGMIDGAAALFKQPRGTTRHTMDEKGLLRKDDEERYREILDKPLFNCAFKWTGGGEVSLDHFAAEPTQGKLSFGTYSDLNTGADYVVREILKRN